MKYRKKPIVIEAVQIDDATFDAAHPNPDHLRGVVYDPRERCVFVDTLEGRMRGDLGDWIITGVKGEHYPCKDDIFRATYERVEGEPLVQPKVERVRWATYDDGARMIDSTGASVSWVWPFAFGEGWKAQDIGTFATEAEARAAVEQAWREAHPGSVLEIMP